MQFISEDDLLNMGVTELGARRKLMAARATRAQYESMSKKIEVLTILTMAILTMARLTMARLTVATLTVATLTVARLTVLLYRCSRGKTRGCGLRRSMPRAILRAPCRMLPTTEMRCASYAASYT